MTMRLLFLSVRPSALAVLRLIANSSFLCSLAFMGSSENEGIHQGGTYMGCTFNPNQFQRAARQIQQKERGAGA
jgi:hypothetical protein